MGSANLQGCGPAARPTANAHLQPADTTLDGIGKGHRAVPGQLVGIASMGWLSKGLSGTLLAPAMSGARPPKREGLSKGELAETSGLVFMPGPPRGRRRAVGG